MIRSQRRVPAGSTNLSGGRVGHHGRRSAASRAARASKRKQRLTRVPSVADDPRDDRRGIGALGEDRGTLDDVAPGRVRPRSRVTKARIASSSTPHTVLAPRNRSAAILAVVDTGRFRRPAPVPVGLRWPQSVSQVGRTTAQRRPATAALADLQVAMPTANPDVLENKGRPPHGTGDCGGTTLVSLSASCRAFLNAAERAMECVADLVRAGASGRGEQAGAHERPLGEPSQPDSDGPSHFQPLLRGRGRRSMVRGERRCVMRT